MKSIVEVFPKAPKSDLTHLFMYFTSWPSLLVFTHRVVYPFDSLSTSANSIHRMIWNSPEKTKWCHNHFEISQKKHLNTSPVILRIPCGTCGTWPPHHPWRVPMVSSCLRVWLGRRTLGEDAHAALADVQKPLEQAGPAILLAVAGESWNGWKGNQCGIKNGLYIIYLYRGIAWCHMGL